MTSVREIVDTPGMPGWVRCALALMGAILLRLAASFASPMLDSGWTWGHGIATLIAALIGIDLLHSAWRKRWPLVLFADLLVGRIVSGRWH